MLRAAGRDRAHSKSWQKPRCLGPREGRWGPRLCRASQALGRTLFIVLRALGSQHRIHAGADVTGRSSDCRYTVDVGRPERRQLQLSRQMRVFGYGLLVVSGMSEQN